MRFAQSAAAGAAIAVTISLSACGGGGGEETTSANAPTVDSASTGTPTARLDRIARIGEPTSIATPPGQAQPLFVTTKQGSVYIVDGGRLRRRPFLDLTGVVNSTGSEQGMFSIAFAPDYAKSRRFYVAYNDSDNNVQVNEYRRSVDNPLEADPDSRQTIITARHGEGNRTQHNGGELEFGPDGYLYIGFGDGGPVSKPFVTNRAQQTSSLLGKILRIDPLHPSPRLPYSIPHDNPYFGSPHDRDEVYAYGLRNPFRFSFDSRTGDLAIGDVGAANIEEVDYLPYKQASGANFGWPEFEGDTRFRRDYRLLGNPTVTMPVLTYTHDRGCSVIGGFVAHDPRLPELEGRYVYSDACSGDIRSFVPSAGGAEDDRSEGLRLSPGATFGIVSFGEGADGRLYAASFNGGVYALDPQ